MSSLVALAHDAALVIAVLSASVLGGLLLYNLARPSFGLWPAPESSGWRHRLSFGLFRVFCGATVVFALLDFAPLEVGGWVRWVIGAPIMLGAFGATLWGYRFLGIDNTYCEADGLVTTGLYACSRNPQYVFSVAATVGLGLTAASATTIVLAGVLFALYFLFALNEERWLADGYGAAFRSYKKETPRFIDERSIRRARSALAARR
ncbi:MAG TPA: PEMT/PEM2 methyltransferase family protein [Paracoccaceae bacterium]|nr:PEMT/PEM2 methyltransferase family protein [Paracoccaceae bacterium]